MKDVYLIQNEIGRENKEYLETVSKLTLIPVSKLEEIADLDQIMISKHYVENIVRNIEGINQIEDLETEVDLLEEKYGLSVFIYKMI